MIDIIADCPGALGMFWRYKWLVEQHQVNYDQIDAICFEAACEYDELCFADEDGGIYSKDKYKNKTRGICEELTRDKNYVFHSDDGPEVRVYLAKKQYRQKKAFTAYNLFTKEDVTQ